MPDRGPSARRRAQPSVPGGASAVIEHEGLVGVAPAARLPVDAPRAARAVGQRHAGRRRLGPGAEGEASGRDRRLLPSLGLEIHFSLSVSKEKKNVPGSWFGRLSGRAPYRPRPELQPRRAVLAGRGPVRILTPVSGPIGARSLPNPEKQEGAQSHRDLREGWCTLGRWRLKRTSDDECPAGCCLALSCWADQHLCPDPPLPHLDNGHSSGTRTETCLSVRVTRGSPAGPGARGLGTLRQEYCKLPPAPLCLAARGAPSAQAEGGRQGSPRRGPATQGKAS